MEAVLARAGGPFGDDVHGSPKVDVCGSVGDGERVRTPQEVQQRSCSALTCVTVRLKVTAGFFGVLVLILVAVAGLALRLLTAAQRRHSGPWREDLHLHLHARRCARSGERRRNVYVPGPHILQH